MSLTLPFLFSSNISSLPTLSVFVSLYLASLSLGDPSFTLAWMNLSFALPHVHCAREQSPGIGVNSLLKILQRINGLDTLDQKTLKELIEQDDEVSGYLAS